jgi:hypothetical protein
MQIRRHITHGVILPRLGVGKSEPRQLTLSGSHKLAPSVRPNLGILSNVSRCNHSLNLNCC